MRRRAIWCLGTTGILAAVGVAAYIAARLSHDREVIARKILTVDPGQSPYCVWLSSHSFAIGSDKEVTSGIAVYEGKSNDTWSRSTRPVDAALRSGVEKTKLSETSEVVEYLDGNSFPVSRLTKQFGIAIPEGAGNLVALAASNDHEHVALILKRTSYSTGAFKLERIFPRLLWGRHTDADLWLCDVKTKVGKRIGQIVNDVPSDAVLPLTSFQWTPNSTRISFIYGSGLYVAPVQQALLVSANQL